MSDSNIQRQFSNKKKTDQTHEVSTLQNTISIRLEGGHPQSINTYDVTSGNVQPIDQNLLIESYMDEESIETLESVRPAGSIVPSSQDNYYNYMDEESRKSLASVRSAGSVAPSSQNSHYLGYKHDPLEYEGATFDLQATEDKTVIGDNVEERDSPVNEDKHAKIKEMNGERGDKMDNDGVKDKHNE